MRSPSVRADNSEIASFHRSSKIKKRGVGVERADIMSVKPSMKQSTSETLYIAMCLTSNVCEGFERWRTWVILWLFQNISCCRFPASAKKLRFLQHRASGVLLN
jgi:hypothetical protein